MSQLKPQSPHDSPSSNLGKSSSRNEEPVTFTGEEYDQLRSAMSVALSMMHYANRDRVTALPLFDKNIMTAIGEIGPAYRMIKAKVGDK